MIPNSSPDCAPASAKRPYHSISNIHSAKRRRISLASVDISREFSSVEFSELDEGTSADRFIPARPKNIIPLNITPRTSRIARVFGLADERVLNCSDVTTTPEVKMFSLLRKSASQLFEPVPAARPTSVLSNLATRKQFLLALDAPGIPNHPSTHPMAWSSTNSIAVASWNDIFYQNLENRTISRLCKVNPSLYGILHVIEWGGKEMPYTLALGTLDGVVQLWDAAVGQCTDKGKAYRSWQNWRSCRGMSWHGHTLAVGWSGGSISMYDVREKKEVRRIEGHRGRVNGMKFSHDGRYIASGDENGGVYIWDARACKSLTDGTKMTHGGPVEALAWCPWKPDLLATGSMFPEGKIRIWSSNSSALSPPLHTIPLNTSVTSLQWSPHCKELLSTHGPSWAPQTTLARLRRIPPRLNPVRSPLTNSITVHSYPSCLRLVSVIAHPGPVGQSCLGPDGTMVFTMCPKEESMKMWKVWGLREDVKTEESVFDKCVIR